MEIRIIMFTFHTDNFKILTFRNYYSVQIYVTFKKQTFTEVLFFEKIGTAGIFAAF